MSWVLEYYVWLSFRLVSMFACLSSSKAGQIKVKVASDISMLSYRKLLLHFCEYDPISPFVLGVHVLKFDKMSYIKYI